VTDLLDHRPGSPTRRARSTTCSGRPARPPPAPPCGSTRRPRRAPPAWPDHPPAIAGSWSGLSREEFRQSRRGVRLRDRDSQEWIVRGARAPRGGARRLVSPSPASAEPGW